MSDTDTQINAAPISLPADPGDTEAMEAYIAQMEAYTASLKAQMAEIDPQSVAQTFEKGLTAKGIVIPDNLALSQETGEDLYNNIRRSLDKVNRPKDEAGGDTHAPRALRHGGAQSI